MSRVLVISYSDLGRDARVDRQIGFLRGRHEVTAAGLGPPAYEDVAFVDLGSETQRAPSKAGRARLLLWLASRRAEAAYWTRPENRVAEERLRDHGADLVIANDVAALPLACRIAGDDTRVILDAHEMATTEWSQVWWWRLLIAPYVDQLLRRYLPRVDGMMTVSAGIAEMYARRYGLQPVVVTNACRPADLAPTPVHRPIRMICHGAADPQRRLELMVHAAGLLGSAFSLELMLVPTDPHYLDRLRQLAGASPNVSVSQPQSQRDLVAYLNDYDLGVYLLPPLNENALHALPNKLFEFVQARLGVVVGPSPEMAAVVREWQFGEVAPAFTAEALATAVSKLTPERIGMLKLKADQAAGHLNSERNREIVLDLLDRVLSDDHGSAA